MWLIGLTVVSHIDDMIHHLLVLLLALFEETAYLRHGCVAVLLTGLTLSEIVASLRPINFFWLIGHGTSPRTRHFPLWGILQIHEKNHAITNWEGLCELLLEKFGREQYQALLRQFNTLKQQGSVSEYMNQFEDLMHQILAHNPAIDALFFTT